MFKDDVSNSLTENTTKCEYLKIRRSALWTVTKRDKILSMRVEGNTR